MSVGIERLEDLQPGDVMFGPIGGLVGLGVGLGELIVDGGLRVGQMSVRHVGIVVEASRTEEPSAEWPTGVITRPRLVQAMPGGAEEVPMTDDQHWTSRHAYARLPEDWPGQGADAAMMARLMVAHGVGYSYASYLALAAWHWGLSTPKLEAWIGRRQPHVTLPGAPARISQSRSVALPCEAICSVLVDQAWSMTGKKIMTGVPHQCVTPSQLASQLLTRTPETVWGWPSKSAIAGVR